MTRSISFKIHGTSKEHSHAHPSRWGQNISWSKCLTPGEGLNHRNWTQSRGWKVGKQLGRSMWRKHHLISGGLLGWGHKVFAVQTVSVLSSTIPQLSLTDYKDLLGKGAKKDQSERLLNFQTFDQDLMKRHDLTKTSQELRMLSPSLFIQGSQSNC